MVNKECDADQRLRSRCAKNSGACGTELFRVDACSKGERNESLCDGRCFAGGGYVSELIAVGRAELHLFATARWQYVLYLCRR